MPESIPGVHVQHAIPRDIADVATTDLIAVLAMGVQCLSADMLIARLGFTTTELAAVRDEIRTRFGLNNV